jgi:uncharacterized membrane protein
VNLLAKTTGEPCSPSDERGAWPLCVLAQSFRARRNTRTANFNRFWNEVPAILLRPLGYGGQVLFLIIVAAKPF